MSADEKTPLSDTALDGLRDEIALKAAALKLGIEMTAEILPGVTQNLELLSTHYANVCEAKPYT